MSLEDGEVEQAAGHHGSNAENNSLELIKPSELYPKPKMKVDDPCLHVPFPVLCGESVLYLGKTSEGTIALSNYRLFLRFRQSFVNVPLGLIEMVESRDIFYLYIYCKDAHSFRCTFGTNQECLEWYSRVANAVLPPAKLHDVFSFVFHAWCKSGAAGGSQQNGGGAGAEVSEHEVCYQLCRTEDNGPYSFGKEVERLGFNLKKTWRISYINDKFDVCGSYPRLHIVPAVVEDRELKNAANFRACRRFPSVVWRHQKNGAVIARSSQPEVGWLGWRNKEDEQLLQAILNACVTEAAQTAAANGASTAVSNGSTESSDEETSSTSSSSSGTGESTTLVNGNSSGNKQMLIIDARSYAAAVANRAKGGGCECIEYYPSCEIQFMSLANIHAIRKSFHALRTLCSSSSTDQQHSWLTGLENTRWLSHMASLLRASLLVVHAVHKEGRPVLVHCSDGWDRTPQLVALAQIMMDPYYRTIEGFRMLVEREWLEFGHKFSDRCGVGRSSEDVNERCPVFLQWLDCIHQMLNQFPCAFQFNHAYLVKLAQHTYANLFGTFLCNNVKDRTENNVRLQTTSLWTMLGGHNKHFVNTLYEEQTAQLVQPSAQVRDLVLWRSVYLCEGSATSSPAEPAAATTPSSSTEDPAPSDEESTATAAPSALVKTRSCDNLSNNQQQQQQQAAVQSERRLSDPSVGVSGVGMLAYHSQHQQDKADIDVTAVEQPVPDPSSAAATAKAEPLVITQQDHVPGVINSDVIVNGHSNNKESVKSVPTSSISQMQEEGEHGENSQESKLCDSRSSNMGEDYEDEELGHKEGSPQTMRIRRPSVEGSTETLTGMDSSACRTSQPFSHNSPIASRSVKLLMANMSTSTSDITDSHVVLGAQHGSGNCLDSALLTLSIGGGGGGGGGQQNGGVGGQQQMHQSNQQPSPPHLQPFGSLVNGTSLKVDVGRCQSSGTESDTSGSPSPGAEAKTGWVLASSRGGISRQLDVDGLTMYQDPVQARMLAMETSYTGRIQQLEKQLHLARLALYHYASGNHHHSMHFDHTTPMMSLDSDGGGGPETGQEGGNASDASWEQVDETEAELTKWIPNHAVTHCAGCDGEFWVARRKHHCRKCGRIFCSDCSQYFIPVPEQQLDTPVRVCNKCYSTGDSDDGGGGVTCGEGGTNSSPALLMHNGHCN